MDFEFSTSTWMLLFFILFLAISIWKIYAFLPNKQLDDDDTTDDAQNELLSIMVDTVKRHSSDITTDELYIYMVENEDFNKEKYWRFNKNRLNKLLELYYLKNQDINSINDIYNKAKG